MRTLTRVALAGLVLTATTPEFDDIGRWVLMACPVYMIGLGAWRTAREQTPLPAIQHGKVAPQKVQPEHKIKRRPFAVELHGFEPHGLIG